MLHSGADISAHDKNNKNSNNQPTILKFLIDLDKIIFNLTEDNLLGSVQNAAKLFDTNFPDTFNVILCNLVYNAFSSQRNAFDIYLNFLKTFQTKEDELTQNINKLISIFIKRISKINSQEAFHIISQLNEQNLIDTNMNEKIKIKFYKKYKGLSNNDLALHKQYIKEGHNPNEIAKIIRNDEIEKLQEISSQTNFDFNQKIKESLYERCSFVNHWDVTLIDYAAFFSAVKCFKYLLMNGSNVENTGKYAVAGGNEEIIHLCEQNHSSFKDAYKIAIKFHRNDIFKYLYDNKFEELQPNTLIQSILRDRKSSINDLACFCICEENYEILSFLFEEGIDINDNMIIESARKGNLYLVCIK